jgi:hypothetical protein
MNPVATAEMLRTYGPWAVCVVLLGFVGTLWRALSQERAKRDADAQGFHMAQIQAVRDGAERERAFSDTVRTLASRIK